MKVDVIRCARCGKKHLDLEFKRLSQPRAEFQWWALCPKTKEPILLEVIE